MSRAKYDENNPYNLLFAKIGWFKVNYTDFLYDFRFIYQDILDFYGDKISPYNEDIEERLKVISKANVKPAFKNRFYITTNIGEVVLAVVDIDESVFNNLAMSFKLFSALEEDPFQPEIINMSYISTIYFFEGDELIQFHTLSPYKLAQFMMVFKNENIVNYQGARDTYYAKPRRYAKAKEKIKDTHLL